MTFHTLITEFTSFVVSATRLAKEATTPRSQRRSAALSRREVRQIVAEMLG
jgi:hypothetical protein